VHRLTAEGWDGAINLPKLSEELYRSARWLRVFACRRVEIPRAAVYRLVSLTPDEVAARVREGTPLLA